MIKWKKTIDTLGQRQIRRAADNKAAAATHHHISLMPSRKLEPSALIQVDITINSASPHAAMSIHRSARVAPGSFHSGRTTIAIPPAMINMPAKYRAAPVWTSVLSAGQ